MRASMVFSSSVGSGTGRDLHAVQRALMLEHQVLRQGPFLDPRQRLIQSRRAFCPRAVGVGGVFWRFDPRAFVPERDELRQKGVGVIKAPDAPEPDLLTYEHPQYFKRTAEYFEFILSLNDRPEVRRIFAAFTITPVKTTYSVGRKGRGKERGELLIMNGKRRRAATAD